MGVGGKFWDLLKPYARHEGFDFLRNKRVAVDLSFWIVQHETAIKARTRSPHLRLTFFRTINLFAKFGAFPVFVVDGTPSPLKSQARIARFFRFSGIDPSSLPVIDDGVSVERNSTFTKYIQECVELLESLGMPVLKAKGEAEALCSQLNHEGYVDACITSDNDAFLFGAKCVIKNFRSNSKEPFECYYMSDIETGLGLKREHLIAISLLAGNDHDLNGVQGIGLETALRFAQNFSEDEILTRLHEIGNGNASRFQDGTNFVDDDIVHCLDESPSKTKVSHCSFCGHPGSKRAHFKFPCEQCATTMSEGCTKKPEGFKCSCFSCDMDRREREQKKQQNWQLKVLSKIALEPNFPNDDIVEMYLCNSNGYFNANEGPCISWGSPKTEVLVDFLGYHQLWEPSYTRRMMLPLLSTIFLREMAKNPLKSLLYGQYEFDSIDRLKIRYGNRFYVVKWRKAAPAGYVSYTETAEELDMPQNDVLEVDEYFNPLDESDDSMILINDGLSFLLTDENTDLVHAAFPEEVDRFLKEKELKESKITKTPRVKSTDGSKGIQLSIKEFYRSAKVQYKTERGEALTENTDDQKAETSKEKRKPSSSNLPKSVRRRLLFG